MSLVTKCNSKLLSVFLSGMTIDLCVEPSNQFGKLFPNSVNGLCIKRGSIAALKAKGLIACKTVFIFGIEYKRFTITKRGSEAMRGDLYDLHQ